MFSRFKQYLKECLRTALKSLLTDDSPETESVDPNLEVLLYGKSGPFQAKYLIIGVIGTRLQGIPACGREKGVRLISSDEAIDKQQFQKLWKLHKGETVRLVWEDTKEEVQN